MEGVWVFITADLAIFALLFGSFLYDRYLDPELFEASRETLNINLGGIDTLILLTSSWFAALAVDALKRNDHVAVPRYLVGAIVTGLAFVISKSIEYGEKFSVGLTPGTNTFYMWYFTLTGIHLLHVLAGTALLTLVWAQARRRIAAGGVNRALLECAASFWHLVDLLWIILFPLLYLLR